MVKEENVHTPLYAIKKVCWKMVNIGWSDMLDIDDERHTDEHEADVVEEKRYFDGGFYRFDYLHNPVTPIFTDSFAAMMWMKYLNVNSSDEYKLVELNSENVIPQEFEQYPMTLEMVVKFIDIFQKR